MSLDKPVSLMDVHSELSCILHAANLAFEDCGAYPTLQYRNRTYLELIVEVWTKKSLDIVCARLAHGLLNGPYDYRFTLISRPVLDELHTGPMYVSAKVDLSHNRRKGRE